MKLAVDLTQLERAAARINGPSYVAGFDAALAGQELNQDFAAQVEQPAMYVKGFHYGTRLKQERPGG